MTINSVKIVGIKDGCADLRAAKDVVVGKTYYVEYDEDGDAFFIDEAGDQNYGVDGDQIIYVTELFYSETENETRD